MILTTRHWRYVAALLLITAGLMVWCIRYTGLTQASEPRLVCEPEGPSPGDGVTVTGEGFSPGAGIQALYWDEVLIPWTPVGATVGGDGRLALSLTAPADTYELHTLVIADGGGLRCECYINLTPRNPTPTFTPPPTLTPSPTPTWTPGPPPGLIIPPTPPPGPDGYCAEMAMAFTRNPIAGGIMTVGLEVKNIHIAWPEERLMVGLWQYRDSVEADTGARVNLPALAGGETTTLPLSFQEDEAGPIWYQARLMDRINGAVSACVSPWQGLYIREAAPLSPAPAAPPDHAWLGVRNVGMTWFAAQVPEGADPVAAYEVRLMADAAVLYQTESQNLGAGYMLTADYGLDQLSWQVRARNSAGWGPWSSPYYFGVDTGRPAVQLTVHGDIGPTGWYRSPVRVSVTGQDPAPGSGLAAAFLQIGSSRWRQVVPGTEMVVSQEGELMLRAYGQDQALNRSPVVLTPVRLDLSAPEMVEPQFAYRPAASGWYTAPVTITVAAQDLGSGVAERLLRVDGAAWQAEAVALTTNGLHTIEFLARDLAGNESPLKQTTAKLDLIPPEGSLSVNGSLCQRCSPLTATVVVTDAGSSIGHWTLAWTLPAAPTGDLRAAGSDTILASGSEPGQISLNGGDLPVGTLTLRLAVQDVAGWLTYYDLEVVNGAVTPGPTPTGPVTATPWPTPVYTGTLTSPAATATRAATSRPSGPGGTSPPESQAGGSPEEGAGYPVGGQVVPAILPVTGGNHWAGIYLVLLPSVIITGTAASFYRFWRNFRRGRS